MPNKAYLIGSGAGLSVIRALVVSDKRSNPTCRNATASSILIDSWKLLNERELHYTSFPYDEKIVGLHLIWVRDYSMSRVIQKGIFETYAICEGQNKRIHPRILSGFWCLLESSALCSYSVIISEGSDEV